MLKKDNRMGEKQKADVVVRLLQKAYDCSFTEVDSLVETMTLFHIGIDELEEYDVWREGFGLFEIQQAVIEIVKSRMLGDNPDLMESIVEGYVPGGRYISYHFVVDTYDNFKKIEKYIEKHNSKEWNLWFLARLSFKRG